MNVLKFRAFLEKSELHILYDTETDAKDNLHLHTELGRSLLDYMALKPEALEETFTMLRKRYHLCTLKRDNTDEQMRHSLLNAMKHELQGNAYLAGFLSNSIVILYEAGVSDNLLEAISHALDEPSKKLRKRYSEAELKQMYLRLLPRVIANQQKQLKVEVNLLWGSRPLFAKFTPEQRLYLLANSNDVTIYYLKKLSTFCSTLNTVHNYFRLQGEALQAAILNDDAQVFEMYEFVNLDELLGFELAQMALKRCNVKQCAYCGGWFIPEGRVDSKYCNRIADGEKKPCCEIGAFRKRAELVKTDPVYVAYTAALKRMSKRKRQPGGLTERQYRDWAWQVQEKRDQCLDGTITLAEFEGWLDETSRVKQRRKTIASLNQRIDTPK